MRGSIIFLALILIAALVSIAAYLASGHMGIEERFNSAAGIQDDGEEEEPSGVFGFFIEGSTLYYAIIFSALAATSVIVYYKSRSA